MSPHFGIHFRSVAIDTRSLSSGCESTGAKQSVLDQSFGSWLPRTTMQYFAHFGLLPFSSFLIVEIAIVGRALPVTFINLLYSGSVITSHVFRAISPLYSSEYAASHVSRSSGWSWWCRRRLGASMTLRSFADTWRAMILEVARANLAVKTGGGSCSPSLEEVFVSDHALC